MPSVLRDATGLIVFNTVPLALMSDNSMSRFIMFATGSAFTLNLELLLSTILKKSSSALGPIRPSSEKVELLIR